MFPPRLLIETPDIIVAVPCLAAPQMTMNITITNRMIRVVPKVKVEMAT